MRIIKAPDTLPERTPFGPSKVFLAGSIDMGNVKNWQHGVEDALANYNSEQLIVFNPRRDIFDSSQEQSSSNHYFSEQVNWELDALEMADYVLMYFHPNTPAPISLLELGLHADSICKLVVVCPDGFYRQGNVEIVCNRFKIPFFKELADGVDEIRSYIDYDNHIIND